MQFIFDHLIAILIAGVVILVLVMNQMRTLEDGLEDTSVYIAKNNTLDLAEMIESDLNMTLHRFDTDQDPFDWAVTTTDLEGRTTLFQLYRDSVDVSTATTHRIETRYRLNFVDSVYVNAIDSLGNSYIASNPLFEVIREECSYTTIPYTCLPADFDHAGSSAPWVKDFRITPLQQDKSLASNITEAHYLQVSFIMSPPLQTERQVVDKLHWSTLLQVQPF